MPDQVLRNPRHERFAPELATGKSADAAYVQRSNSRRGERHRACRSSKGLRFSTYIFFLLLRPRENLLEFVAFLRSAVDIVRDFEVFIRVYENHLDCFDCEKTTKPP